MSDDRLTDAEAAVRFLEWKQPGGPWPLTVTDPEWKTGTPTSWLKTTEEIRGFVGQHSAGKIIFYTTATQRDGVTKKPSKSDLVETRHLHVDLDPPKAIEVSAVEEWIQSALVTVRTQTHSPPPSAIVRSGNGLHLLWELDEPFFLGGAPERIADIEERTRALCADFGADLSTWNADRLLRLPGTANLPNAKKRGAGRAARPATIVELHVGRVYSLADFRCQPEERRTNPRRKGGGEALLDRERLVQLGDPAELDNWGVPPWVDAVIVHGSDPTEPERWGGDRSDAVFAVACTLARQGVPPGLIAGILTDATWGISAHVLDQSNPTEYAWRQVERALQQVDKAEVDPRGQRVLDPSAPLDTARRLRDELFPNSIHTNDDFLEYERGAYRTVEDATMRSVVWAALGAAVIRKVTRGAVTFEPFRPGPGQVSSVLDALKGLAHQPADRMAPPVWLDGEGPPPGEIISCRNGLLHVPTAELLAPTPRFLTRNALDLDFNPDAPEPVAWHAFVAAVFPDADAAALLQEWFGYYLLPDTSQEKMLLMVGPPRSGKGTIQKVLTELVGRTNVCAPSIKSLGGNFGLQPMIGKQVAFLSDIRIGSGSDRAAITETLLRITGRDDVTADRKNKEAWTGRLAVRFFIATNEMPSLSDNSPALANRFVPLLLERSFLGKEDPTLADRLIKELPGILNWSLIGWRRLRDRGHFSLPAASKEAIGEIMELGSPVAAFIRDTCHVAPGHRVEKERLFAAWQRWCEVNNLAPGRMEHFARSLRAVTSHQVDSARPSIDGQRTYVFEGISLVPEPPY